MECAKTLISTMPSLMVMQTTKTGIDKCKAGLYATLVIKSKLYIGSWCNGSTTDFDSVGRGSKPLDPAINIF